MSVYRKLACTALAAFAVTCLPMQAAMAQTDSSTASPATGPAAKAQRKADRKATRAKNNAELGKLEKNGYKPEQDRADYPKNLQDAEKKSGE